eukprot:Lithocolla_globosa_v1_NODE_684_length_3444_cov_23.143755.p2 type:complete len:234 gc:universal NODE_684_length_3444_cov_23.143755:1432-2133(+)
MLACWICDHQLADRSSMSYHMKTRHYQSLPTHVCHECGRGFFRQSSLARHSLVHKPKSHRCSVCGKLFRRADSLRAHSRHHTSFAVYKYDTSARQVAMLLSAQSIFGCVLDPCGGAGTSLHRALQAAGCAVVTNDKYRDARHNRDLYCRSSLLALKRKYNLDAVVSSPPYGRLIQPGIDNMLSLKAPVTALKIPVSVAKRQRNVTLFVSLPREKYPGFAHCIKYPECWAVWRR